MQKYIERLSMILTKNNVCRSHGIDHAIAVMNNAQKALNHASFNRFSKEQYECVLLAALLHDADDRKFFPNNSEFENLKDVLQDKTEYIPLVSKMVDLVSSSKNGDRIPSEAIDNEWLLYPRYADRIEALGVTGIERCFRYALTANNPLYVSTTPCPETEEENWKYATQERYDKYNGKSDSMIDHYYDKLLRASFIPIKNEYFEKVAVERRKALIDFLIYFGKNKRISKEDVEKFIQNY